MDARLVRPVNGIVMGFVRPLPDDDVVVCWSDMSDRLPIESQTHEPCVF